MTAPAWMTPEQAAAHARGSTRTRQHTHAAAHARGTTAAERACSGVDHHAPAQPTYDPDYRPQVRTPSAPSATYRPTGRDPLAPWWERYAGLACTCPPGCTHRTWGDGGTCVRSCVPCTEMRGQAYQAKPKTKKKTATTDREADAA